jgi:hypothetical protein
VLGHTGLLLRLAWCLCLGIRRTADAACWSWQLLHLHDGDTELGLAPATCARSAQTKCPADNAQACIVRGTHERAPSHGRLHTPPLLVSSL